MCFACLKLLLRSRKRSSKPIPYRAVRPGSVNNSTFNSSAQQKNSSNVEIDALMSQVQRSRNTSYYTPHLGSMNEPRGRRYSETSEEYFIKSMQKRQKQEMISRECFQLYKEVAGVLILDHQLRQQIRRTPPIKLREIDRQNSW
jgi:hypothetical protein